jgi:hypothetical protein
VKVLIFRTKSFVPVIMMLFVCAAISYAQQPVKSPTPTLVINNVKKDLPIAARNNLYCAGYIQNAPVNTNFEIVGADDEREQNVFVQGEYIYINRGAGSGARVGDMLSVIRPRGKFSSRFSKKGRLGIYVQEVGSVEIVKVKPEVSVARIKTSCENFLLGDLIQPMAARVSPLFQERPALDVFGEPSGKATGRIVLSRDGREALSREQIVYIDLGAEDSVQVGDYLTVYRPLGKGGVINSHQDETLSARDKGFQSKVYRSGTFSIMAPRKSGDNADGHIVTTNDAKKGRPQNLRKVVGEMVILNVKERTATAVITRNAEEIHTGDMVEVQ